MKFQILNNEELGFFDNNGVKKAIMKLSGSNFILDPVDTGANIIMGQGETVNDLELGIASTPVNMTFLGGGTISSNGGTLFIGDSSNSDSVILTGVTISSSVNFPTGITGSFQGTHTGTFIGNGSQLTGVTATVSPGGDNKNIQFNDNNTDTSGSNNFTFNKTTDTVKLTGSLDVSGSASADFFFGDGSGLTNIIGAFPFTGSAGVSGSIEVVGPITASDIVGGGSLNSPFTGSVNVSGSFDLIGPATATSFIGNGSGLTGITSTFAPTGQDKSIQFNKNGSEVSGSAFLLFDYDNSSLYVKEAISSSIFTGSFVGDGSQITNGAWSGIFTGSAEITGSLDIIGTTTISNNATITGSLFIEKNNSTLAIGKGVNDGGYNTSTLIGTNARAYGEHATAIGLNTGAKSYAVGIGWYAMQNGGGGFSVGIGSTSHRFNTGGQNVAVGQNTLLYGSGGSNVALGSATMESGGSNTYNTAVGFNTSRNMVGDYNVTLGYQTGHSSLGSKNILIGHQAGYNFTGSNHLIISNNSSSALIQGDFDNDTLYVSGTLVAKEISGSTADVFQVQSHNGSTLFEVRPGFIQFGNLGDSLGIDFSGGNRYFKGFNTGFDFQGGIPFNATSTISFNPTNGYTLINNRFHFRTSNLLTNVSNAQEINFTRAVNHLPAHAIIRGDDNQYQPVPIYIFGGKHTTDGTYKPVVLQYDIESGSRGNVGIGKEPNYTLDIQSGTSSNLRLGSSTTNQGEHKIGFGFHDGDNAMGVAIIGKADGSSGKGSLSFAAHSGGDNASASYDDRALEINSDHVITYKPVRATDDVFTIGGSNTGDVGLFLHEETRTAIVSKLLGGSNTSDIRLVTGIPKNAGMVSASADQYARLTITQDGNTEISGTLSIPGFPDISASLASAGSGGAAFPHTGSAIISGSLIIDGGPLDSSVFEVNGTQGQLFSITDSLSGSLFAVSDVSGLPILEVFSDDTIKMGSFNNEALEISGSDVNFNNLPTSDPGVSGTLFQTGSDAIGATAGFQVICISQG